VSNENQNKTVRIPFSFTLKFGKVKYTEPKHFGLQ